jgi:hypothetical protein
MGVQPAGVASVVYTCPVGVVAVVREVLATPYAAANAVFYVSVAATATAVGMSAVAAFRTQQQFNHTVLRAGDILTVTAVGAIWEYIISGYELGP